MTDATRDARGRFPPGRSGNRNGRPKKPKTVSEAIISAMNKTVAANENGRKRRIRKLDATATQIANKGASGQDAARHGCSGRGSRCGPLGT